MDCIIYSVYRESIWTLDALRITNLCIVTALLAAASVCLEVVQSSLVYPVLHGTQTDLVDIGWVNVQPHILAVLDSHRPDWTVAGGAILGPLLCGRRQLVAPRLHMQRKNRKRANTNLT